MEKKFYLIATAGGHGSRMGGPVPKQFLTLDGKAILHLTLEKFIRAIPGIKIITVLPEECMSQWREYCIVNNFHYPQTLVSGGITRFHSVRAALAKVPDGAVVAIQDGVRPLISEALIVKMFQSMEEVRALIPVMPATDTLKVLEKDSEGVLHETSETLDRTKVFGAQTPQIFLSGEIKKAYSQAYDTAFTDDASVAAAYGIPLSFIEGEKTNLKITTPEDLLLAEAILRCGGNN